MKKIKVYLFGLIPILKIKKFKDKVKVYLFNCILIYKYTIKKNEFEKTLLEPHDIIGLASDANLYTQIAEEKVKANTILLVEPNLQFHSECLPGYVKLLNDLNYHVHILMCNENVRLGALDRCQNLDYKIFGCNSYKTMIAIINTSYIKNRYKKIFITTTLNLQGLVSLFEINDTTNINCVVHSKKTIEEFSLQKLVEENRICVLSYFKNNSMLTVNPHYYGNMNMKHEKNDIVEFITVGRIQKDVKNYNILTNTVRRLLNSGYKNFKVNIVGWFGEIDIDEDIKDNVVFWGKLSFPQMYDLLLKNDYILSLLDEENKAHILYTSDLATGSNQLVLGFKRPYLINKTFAEAYRYNDTNAIIYEKNDLFSAMEKAINLKKEDYSNMQDQIDKLAKELDEISKNNLKVMINND